MELKKWIIKERMTVNQFARKSGLTRQTIHKYLNGQKPRMWAACQVEKATNGEVKVEDLMEIN